MWIARCSMIPPRDGARARVSGEVVPEDKDPFSVSESPRSRAVTESPVAPGEPVEPAFGELHEITVHQCIREA
jgi:hypothetical protein